LGSTIRQRYGITIVKGEEGESLENSVEKVHEAGKEADIENLNKQIRESVIQMNFEED